MLMSFLAMESIFPRLLSAGKSEIQKLLGNWNGIIETANLAIELHITEKSNHTLAGTLYSLDQSSKGIPVSQVTYEKGHLHLDVVMVHGSYDGQMKEDGSGIVGKWRQSGATLELDLKKGK